MRRHSAAAPRPLCTLLCCAVLLQGLLPAVRPDPGVLPLAGLLWREQGCNHDFRPALWQRAQLSAGRQGPGAGRGGGWGWGLSKLKRVGRGYWGSELEGGGMARMRTLMFQCRAHCTLLCGLTPALALPWWRSNGMAPGVPMGKLCSSHAYSHVCRPANEWASPCSFKLHLSCHAGHDPALSFWFNVLGTSKHGLKGLVPPVPHHPPPQVALDPVQYARSGAFTVNLWFKPGKRPGSQPIASVPAPAQLLRPRGSGPPGGLKEQSPLG